MAVDSAGNVYVIDGDNSRIQKFDSSGNFITKWGEFGSGDGQLNRPNGIAVGSSGDIYVIDSVNNRVQKFKPISTSSFDNIGVFRGLPWYLDYNGNGVCGAARQQSINTRMVFQEISR